MFRDNLKKLTMTSPEDQEKVSIEQVEILGPVVALWGGRFAFQ